MLTELFRPAACDVARSLLRLAAAVFQASGVLAFRRVAALELAAGRLRG